MVFYTFNNTIIVDLSQTSNVLDSSSWLLFFLWNQRDPPHSFNLGLRPKDLVKEKLEKHADLRVEHGLCLLMAWRRVTLEKK